MIFLRRRGYLFLLFLYWIGWVGHKTIIQSKKWSITIAIQQVQFYTSLP